MRDWIALDKLPPDELLDCPPPSAGMIRSVEKHGVLEPIIINPVIWNGYPRVVAGRRRVIAARRAGLTTIPYIEQERGQWYTIAAHENHCRSANDITSVKAVKHLAVDGMSDGEIAEELCISHAALKRLKRLATLPDIILAAVERNAMAPSTAEMIAQMSPTARAAAQAALTAKGSLTASGVRSIRTCAARKDVLSLPDSMFQEPEDAKPSRNSYIACTQSTYRSLQDHARANSLAGPEEALELILADMKGYLDWQKNCR